MRADRTGRPPKAGEAAIPLPGFRLLLAGRPLVGLAAILFFSWALVALVCTLWWASQSPPVILTATPIPPGLMSSVNAYPGYLGHGVRGGLRLSVEVSAERISVEKLTPVIPESSRIVTRRFVREFSLAMAALIVAVALSRWAGAAPVPDESAP